MAAPQHFRLAVCLFSNVCVLDFQGPLELFGFVYHLQAPLVAAGFPELTGHSLDITYLAHTLDPVAPLTGPALVPQRTFADVQAAGEQFDVLLIPGGAEPSAVPELVEFAKQHAPAAQYILSVCTGSWILATAGLLDGKRATTNKSTYTMIKEATKDRNIEWVPKARWVVDGKIWTASGVTAGADMANAWLQHVVGPVATKKICGVVELSAREEGDDEWAAYYGLV